VVSLDVFKNFLGSFGILFKSGISYGIAHSSNRSGICIFEFPKTLSFTKLFNELNFGLVETNVEKETSSFSINVFNETPDIFEILFFTTQKSFGTSTKLD